MGYFRLDHYQDSDCASDVAYSAIKAMAKSLEKSLKHEHSQFNTDGPENVALFYESFIIPNIEFYPMFEDDVLYVLARKTIKKLKEKIKNAKGADWDNKKNKNTHIKAYKRMAKSLQGFIGGEE